MMNACSGSISPGEAAAEAIATILRRSPEAVLGLATGDSPLGAFVAAVEGPVTVTCPASVLQSHPHATFVVDEAAAARLTLTDRHRSAAPATR